MEWPLEDGSQCPVCGARALVVTSDPIDEEIAGRHYSVRGIIRNRCNACGEEFLAAGQSDEILQLAIENAREDMERLSSAEIRELRLDLELTQAQLGEQLGVGVGLVGRWERGTVLQGATADRLMRVIRAHPELLPELGYVAREGRGPYRTRE